MPTDDERREVAENLRYLADYPGAPVQYAEQLRDELYGAVFSDWLAHDYSELLQRLADLIDPGDSQSSVTESQKHCDRDALLELVDEMETADPEDLDVAIDYVTECASRIREALGVTDD